MFDYFCLLDRAKAVSLGTADDGGRQLVHFSSSQNKHHVSRWFLECLEECVEGWGRQHVDLINNVDLILAAGRCDVYFIAQSTDLVDTTVAGSINLDDIEVHVLAVVGQVV